LRAKRNYTASYQDLVDAHGFAGAYNSVKRFAGGLCKHEPEQFDRLEFAPGEEAQVDYGEGALTRVPGSERYRKPRLFVMTLCYSRRSYSKGSVEVPARNPGRAYTRRPGTTSVAFATTWCWTTIRRVSSNLICASPPAHLRLCSRPEALRCSGRPGRGT
jgi:hypothetical protein